MQVNKFVTLLGLEIVFFFGLQKDLNLINGGSQGLSSLLIQFGFLCKIFKGWHQGRCVCPPNSHYQEQPQEISSKCWGWWDCRIWCSGGGKGKTLISIFQFPFNGCRIFTLNYLKGFKKSCCHSFHIQQMACCWPRFGRGRTDFGMPTLDVQ